MARFINNPNWDFTKSYEENTKKTTKPNLIQQAIKQGITLPDSLSDPKNVEKRVVELYGGNNNNGGSSGGGGSAPRVRLTVDTGASVRDVVGVGNKIATITQTLRDEGKFSEESLAKRVGVEDPVNALLRAGRYKELNKLKNEASLLQQQADVLERRSSDFNSRYGGKELSKQDYDKAMREQEALQYASMELNRRIREYEDNVKADEQSKSISKSSLAQTMILDPRQAPKTILPGQKGYESLTVITPERADYAEKEKQRYLANLPESFFVREGASTTTGVNYIQLEKGKDLYIAPGKEGTKTFAQLSKEAEGMVFSAQQAIVTPEDFLVFTPSISGRFFGSSLKLIGLTGKGAFKLVAPNISSKLGNLVKPIIRFPKYSNVVEKRIGSAEKFTVTGKGILEYTETNKLREILKLAPKLKSTPINYNFDVTQAYNLIGKAKNIKPLGSPFTLQGLIPEERFVDLLSKQKFALKNLSGRTGFVSEGIVKIGKPGAVSNIRITSEAVDVFTKSPRVRVAPVGFKDSQTTFFAKIRSVGESLSGGKVRAVSFSDELSAFTQKIRAEAGIKLNVKGVFGKGFSPSAIEKLPSYETALRLSTKKTNIIGFQNMRLYSPMLKLNNLTKSIGKGINKSFSNTILKIKNAPTYLKLKLKVGLTEKDALFNIRSQQAIKSQIKLKYPKGIPIDSSIKNYVSMISKKSGGVFNIKKSPLFKFTEPIKVTKTLRDVQKMYAGKTIRKTRIAYSKDFKLSSKLRLESGLPQLKKGTSIIYGEKEAVGLVKDLKSLYTKKAIRLQKVDSFKFTQPIKVSNVLKYLKKAYMGKTNIFKVKKAPLFKFTQPVKVTKTLRDFQKIYAKEIKESAIKSSTQRMAIEAGTGKVLPFVAGETVSKPSASVFKFASTSVVSKPVEKQLVLNSKNFIKTASEKGFKAGTTGLQLIAPSVVNKRFAFVEQGRTFQIDEGMKRNLLKPGVTRLDLKLRELSLQKFTEQQKVSIRQTTRTGTREGTNVGLKDSQMLGIKEATNITEKDAVALAQQQSLAQQFKQAQLLKQTQSLRQLITPRMTVTPRVTISPRLPLLPIIPLPGFKFGKVGFGPGSANVKKGFSVFSRVGGKEVALAVNVPKGVALSIGKSFTGRTTARSFKIKETGLLTRQKDVALPGLFQYRSPKLGGRVSKEGFTFVEKSKYAIDTLSEASELKSARRAKKKKRK